MKQQSLKCGRLTKEGHIWYIRNYDVHVYHSRRMEREAKSKVVASAWGAEFIQCLAALAILPRLIWKNRMTSTFSSKLTKAKGSGLAWCQPEDHSFCWSIHSAKRPFFNSSFSSNYPGVLSVVQHEIEWISSGDDLCLLFCLFLLLWSKASMSLTLSLLRLPYITRCYVVACHKAKNLSHVQYW